MPLEVELRAVPRLKALIILKKYLVSRSVAVLLHIKQLNWKYPFYFIRSLVSIWLWSVVYVFQQDCACTGQVRFLRVEGGHEAPCWSSRLRLRRGLGSCGLDQIVRLQWPLLGWIGATRWLSHVVLGSVIVSHFLDVALVPKGWKGMQLLLNVFTVALLCN